MASDNIRTYKIGETAIKIDRTKCISCATCIIIAPEVFEFDDDLICQVKENPKKVNKKLIKEAVNNCISGALIEDQTSV